MTPVIITHNNNIAAAIREALDLMDLTAMVSGRVVAVKPNETWASVEDTSAVTQPDSLRAVLQYLKKLNPGELIVTGGSGDGETDEIFKIAGLMEVVESEKVTFFDHNRAPFKKIPLANESHPQVLGPQQEVMVNPRVLEYETLIVLSQLKVHNTAGVTLALKNMAMSYPAADFYGHPRANQNRQHYFFDDIHTFIASMAKRFPIDLAITVGHPAMVGQGPIGGRLVETGLVIVSRDAVAADAVGAKLLGFEPETLGQLYKAQLLGVGEIRFTNMVFPALSLERAQRIFNEKAYGHDLT